MLQPEVIWSHARILEMVGKLAWGACPQPQTIEVFRIEWLAAGAMMQISKNWQNLLTNALVTRGSLV